MSPQDIPWWKRAVVYQIYPLSFRDTTGNGKGDLAGIIEQLEYLQQLGVDALWLSPVFPSPMKDFGYDISNYTDIDPIFGNLDSMDELIEASHRHGLRLLLDLVPNHSSDQHPWFRESRASRDSPKRDWYIWRDPAPDGGLPNNWLSAFGGPAWAWDEASGQYYLHTFLAEQPDLNWRNLEVRHAMHDVVRFWLDRGVDGFRVDAVMHLVVDDQFRDNPMREGTLIGKNRGEPYRQHRIYQDNLPEAHEVMREFRAVMDEYPHAPCLVGEVYEFDLSVAAQYYGELDEIHLVLNLVLSNLPWDAVQMRKYVDQFDVHVPAGAQPTLVLGSHDELRIASRFGEEQARVAAMLLLTARGTPFMYYGDELGMLDGEFDPEQALDPWPMRAGLPHLSRDPSRTPMQWNAQPGAGFSDPDEAGKLPTPWLPIHPRANRLNVEVQLADPGSMLNLYRKLLGIRRQSLALSIGSYRPLDGVPEGCYIYWREHAGERYMIGLNFTAEERAIELPEAVSAQLVLSTRLDRDGAVKLRTLVLRGHEGLLLQLD